MLKRGSVRTWLFDTVQVVISLCMENVINGSQYQDHFRHQPNYYQMTLKLVISTKIQVLFRCGLFIWFQTTFELELLHDEIVWSSELLIRYVTIVLSC